MNLSIRLAGLFATAVFIVTALPGFFKQVQPHDLTQMATDTISGVSLMETLLISVGGAVAAAIIGYMIGEILTHPEPRRKKKIYVKKQVKEFDPAALVNPAAPLLEYEPSPPSPAASVAEPPLDLPSPQSSPE